MSRTGETDPFLEKRLAAYDNWLSGGKIPFSSKVIPVSESFRAMQWVLPTEQAMEILRKASSIALENCECRTHYKRCDRPLEVCFSLNKTADQAVAEGRARRISLAEGAEVLRRANESGLVLLSLYMPDYEIYALCCCCSCCCHELQILKLFGRNDLVVRSEYVAVTDGERCVHCGKCVERCPFDARVLTEERMEYDTDACLGCGLCVAVCPVEATSMNVRK